MRKLLTGLLFVALIQGSSAQSEPDLDLFFRAVTDGREKVVSDLLVAHPDWVERELFWGIRPLYRASVLGRPAVVQTLLEKGAKVNETTDRNTTALHAASQNGHLAVVGLLIAYEAHPTAFDQDRDTPLHLAVRHKHLPVVAQLLRGGADPNAANFEGRTPLHEAAGLGQLDLVQALVEGGAELSLVDRHGYTPLGWARTAKRNSFGDVGGYLEAKGALDLRAADAKHK